jgi:hypothetical protein
MDNNVNTGLKLGLMYNYYVNIGLEPGLAA